jgi:hypothetical protein
LSYTWNVIGGTSVKQPESNIAWSNIGGGYENLLKDADHYFMNIGGGRKNQILNSSYGHIGGGNENMITASTRSFIGGGESNHIRRGSDYSSILGGTLNTITTGMGSGGSYSFIVNGQSNTRPFGHLILKPSRIKCQIPMKHKHKHKQEQN